MIEAALKKALPEVPVYLSSRVNPQIEEYPRANTTAVAAYVGPVIDRYVRAVEARLADIGFKSPLRLMRSDGGAATARARATIPRTCCCRARPAASSPARRWRATSA